MRKTVTEFLKTEAGGGVLLALTAALAIALANSPFADGYFSLLKLPLALDLGAWRLELTLKEWVKDGLMAVFFYVVGLELKRELTVGELSDPRAVLLPVASAVGGVLAPVGLYLLVAGGLDPRGWPVPVATDIAFALAALAILAPKADPRLRIFLLTLAVVDDLIAIVLIAVLFTSGLAVVPLAAALALLAAIALVQRRVALPMAVYPIAGLVTWGLAVEAGVHTSVMAVAAAMVVPPRPAREGETLLGRLEHFIHPVSAYFVLPAFAFAAAGVPLAGAPRGPARERPAGRDRPGARARQAGRRVAGLPRGRPAGARARADGRGRPGERRLPVRHRLHHEPLPRRPRVQGRRGRRGERADRRARGLGTRPRAELRRLPPPPANCPSLVHPAPEEAGPRTER